MLQYTEGFFVNRTKEVDKLLHFLNECKYSGSWDTKVDMNIVIKTIATGEFIIGELNKKIKMLEEKVKQFDGSPGPPTQSVNTRKK